MDVMYEVSYHGPSDFQPMQDRMQQASVYDCLVDIRDMLLDGETFAISDSEHSRLMRLFEGYEQYLTVEAV